MDVEKVGKAIAYLRKSAGYTQKELAERIGVSDKAVSKWERGQGMPEIGYLRKLSILLNTDSDSLLSGNVAHHKSEWIGIVILDRNAYGIGAETIIYDKPLLYFLLSYFLLVGIKEIIVACTASDAEYIQKTIRNGEDFGIKIITVVGGMKEVTNIVDRGLLNEKSVMLVYGRCILYGVDQTRFFQKAMLDRTHFTMLVLPKKINQKPIAVSMDKRIIGVECNNDNKLKTQYDFSEIPIVFFPANCLWDIAKYESIASYIEELKEKEKVFVEMLDRGFVEIEVDSWTNIQEASTFLKIVQDKCGMNVYCLEEVAWRRGMISLAQLQELGKRKKGTEYGDYVLSLYGRLSQKAFE